MPGGNFFLDTNILVYLFDDRDSGKQETAAALIEEALADGNGCISYQVAQEWLNVVRHRFKVPLSSADQIAFLHDVLMPLVAVMPSESLYAAAIGISDRWGFSFYDSLIVAAARAAGCDELISEDLQDGQDLEGLKVRNPFV